MPSTLSQLHLGVNQSTHLFCPHNVSNWRSPCGHWGPIPPSNSSKTSSGGLIWTVMSEGSYKVARPVPSQIHLNTLHQANYYLLKASLLQWKQQNFCSNSYFKILAYLKILFLKEGLLIFYSCVKSFIFFLGVTISLSSTNQWVKETSSDSEISENLLSSPPELLESIFTLDWVNT